MILNGFQKNHFLFHFDYVIIRLTPIYFLKSISIGLQNVALQNKVSVPILKLCLKYFGIVKRSQHWPKKSWCQSRKIWFRKQVSESVTMNFLVSSMVMGERWRGGISFRQHPKVFLKFWEWRGLATPHQRCMLKGATGCEICLKWKYILNEVT